MLSLYGEQLRQSQIIRNDLHRPETTAMEPSSVPLPQLVATVPDPPFVAKSGPQQRPLRIRLVIREVVPYYATAQWFWDVLLR